MNHIFSLIAPIVIGSVGIYALHRRVDVFSAMVEGASQGLGTVARIFPALVVLLSGVYMLRASGALDALISLAAPLFSLLGIPPEAAPLVLLRPISGSGALAVGSDIINTYGPDSMLGRTAAVMLGSTETTFYVIAVYFGAAKIKKSRHAIPAALIADLVGFTVAALCVRLLF